MAECPEPTSSGTSSATSSLLVRVEDLVNCQSVEKQRLEFKKSWNKGATKFQVVKTICAFANDFFNVNGGYIVIGVAEDDSSDAAGQIELPPVGINANAIDRIQKEILGACKSLIRPPYSPILSPEVLHDKHVLVIWAQASDNRPHKARESEKGEYKHFIRKGSQTIRASDEEINCLQENSQKIPFDDRVARIETGQRIHHNAVAYTLVMAFLDDINSNMERSKDRSTLQKLNLVAKCGDKAKDGSLKPVLMPKNVALLMFNHHPDFYFPGAKIEVAQLTRDNEVIITSQKTFTGPLQNQIKQCMDYIFSATRKEMSAKLVTYPHQALRESIVNAVYHRGYDPRYPDPIKVNIRPHCLEIISYPGPHHSLKEEEFTKGSVIPPVPARNRRIGEFLRELNLAEARGTGVETIFRTMEKNDNPAPTFKFDLSYFSVTLPAHPKFQAVILMKEVEELEVSGNLIEACEVLQKAIDKDPKIINQHLMQKLLLLVDNNLDHPLVKKYEAQIKTATKERISLLEELEKWLSDKQRARSNITDGVTLIKKLVRVEADPDELLSVTEFARELYSERTLDKRRPVLKSNQLAHQLLKAYGQSLLLKDGFLAFHFATIKYQIYTIITDKKDVRSIRRNPANLKFLTDARDLLQNAVNMTSGEEDPKLFAQQQAQLGYVYFHLWRVRKARKSDYEECFEKAKMADSSIHIKRVL